MPPMVSAYKAVYIKKQCSVLRFNKDKIHFALCFLTLPCLLNELAKRKQPATDKWRWIPKMTQKLVLI